METIRILNQLLALHGSSLPMYLSSARPHHQRGDERAWEAIRHVVDDQRLMIDKIAEQVVSLGGSPDMGEFPMEFTGLHDLSMDYMLRQAIARQKQEMAAIEQLSGQFDSGSQAKALAQESLGAAKAHVQSMEDCLSPAV